MLVKDIKNLKTLYPDYVIENNILRFDNVSKEIYDLFMFKSKVYSVYDEEIEVLKLLNKSYRISKFGCVTHRERFRVYSKDVPYLALGKKVYCIYFHLIQSV